MYIKLRALVFEFVVMMILLMIVVLLLNMFLKFVVLMVSY